MPVGPELPPHLMKRKRFHDEEDESDRMSTPPAKIIAASSTISSPADKRKVLGPTFPPQQEPIHEVINNVAPAQTPARILGPAAPPAPLSEMPSISPAEDNADSSDSDSDYGPALPPPPGSAAAVQAETQRAEAEAVAAEKVRTTKPQRADWMLVPPSDSDWGSRVDPTKLKNRKFASGKGAKAPAEKTGISAIWTETAEQKRQRLEDEVMGRKDTSVSVGASKPKIDDAEAEATAKRIREYNEKNRNKSLYDEHQSAKPREKEDDPSKRAFDREKDMGLGGRIGHSQKKDMLKRAGDFGSRFERGNYL